MNISPEFIYAIAPGARPEIVNAIVANQSILTDEEITDPTEVAWFFGQQGVETQGFTRLEENLFYTSGKRLNAVFPTRFPTVADALPYVRNPQALANKVYGGRYGNRPGTNDGWLFRGSGLMQSTFHDNFAEVEKATGIPCTTSPDLLRSFPGALRAAAVYWNKRDLGRFVRANDIAGLTKAIQGGASHLQERKRLTLRAVNAAKVAPKPTKPVTDWLRNGSTGPRVEQLQRDLQRAGYYDGGKLDGKFGDGTELAVSEFQRDHDLVVDGVVGPATGAALATAGKSGAPIPRPAPSSPPVPAPSEPVSNEPTGLAAIIVALLRVLALIFGGKGRKDG